MRSQRNEGGFSLLEILLALAIVVLMAGIMTVSMNGITQSERLRAGVRKIAGISDVVRANAAASQRTCYLDLDFDKHQFRYRREPDRDDQGRFIDVDDQRILSPDEVLEFKDSFEWEELPRGVFFRRLLYNDKSFYDKGTIEVEYSELGTLNTFVLHIQGGKAEDRSEIEYYSILVNGLTGKSEILEGLASFPTASSTDFNQVMGADAPGARR